MSTPCPQRPPLNRDEPKGFCRGNDQPDRGLVALTPLAEKQIRGEEKGSFTMDDKNTPGNTALSAAPAKVIVRKTKPKVAASVAASVATSVATSVAASVVASVAVPTDDTDEEEDDGTEVVLEEGSASGGATKIPKKVSLAQDREQFYLYSVLKKRNCPDDEIVDVLGIRDSVTDQIRRRDDFMASDDFAHFKNWKKLKTKPPKPAKTPKTKDAKDNTKKKIKFVLTDFDKRRIPDNDDGKSYYVAKKTCHPEPGPKVFYDTFEQILAGHFVDGMIQPILT